MAGSDTGDRKLDETIEESFPASDPPANTVETGIRVGPVPPSPSVALTHRQPRGAMRIGIIGAGMIGSTLAKLWVDAGHDVRMASRHPEELQPVVARLGEHASAGTPHEAATFGEVVLLTVPLKAVPDLARELAPLLAGKVVLDTGNAYARRDGPVARQASAHPRGSAGWAAAMFQGSRWVKAFNTVYFKTLESEAHREGKRVGIPLASDDADALDTAAGLVRDAGFDPVIVGALVRGKEFEPETPPYNTGMSGEQLRTFFSQTTGTARD